MEYEAVEDFEDAVEERLKDPQIFLPGYTLEKKSRRGKRLVPEKNPKNAHVIIEKTRDAEGIKNYRLDITYRHTEGIMGRFAIRSDRYSLTVFQTHLYTEEHPPHQLFGHSLVANYRTRYDRLEYIVMSELIGDRKSTRSIETISPQVTTLASYDETAMKLTHTSQDGRTKIVTPRHIHEITLTDELADEDPSTLIQLISSAKEPPAKILHHVIFTPVQHKLEVDALLEMFQQRAREAIVETTTLYH